IGVKYLRQASCAYSAMPPDLLGNIAASSAWMLFCNAPRQIEIVHRTKAPVVPSAPIEAPSEPMRNPGLASATTKPSHHVIAFRSSRSSTTAVAMQRPSRSGPCSMDKVVQTAARRFYHPDPVRCKGHNGGTVLWDVHPCTNLSTVLPRA